jgi:glycosyltransferase involved in cell wall biosynthesis
MSTSPNRKPDPLSQAGNSTPVPATIDIVLPCLDEIAALPWVLARLPVGARAIVVDNGSSDGSPDLARSLGAEVVNCTRRGYGAACHAGLEAATADLVAFCDCDASIDPGAVAGFAALITSGRADLVVGRRRSTAKNSWPIHARIANHALAFAVRRRTGVMLHDLGPLRVARRESLLALGIIDRRSGYPLETVLRAAEAGWSIVPADVTYTPRLGKSKVTGTVRGTLQAVKDMRGVFAECSIH